MPKFFDLKPTKKETVTTAFDTSYNTNPKNKEAYEARNIRREKPSVGYTEAYQKVYGGKYSY